MGRTVRIAAPVKKEPIDHEDLLIEFRWKNPQYCKKGLLTVGLVNYVGRYGYSVEVLATDWPNFQFSSGGITTVHFTEDYRNICREDLPLYLSLNSKSDTFERILLEE